MTDTPQTTERCRSDEQPNGSTYPPWADYRVRWACQMLCVLEDGSPCDGAETDCTMGDCEVMGLVGGAFGYAW